MKQRNIVTFHLELWDINRDNLHSNQKNFWGFQGPTRLSGPTMVGGREVLNLHWQIDFGHQLGLNQTPVIDGHFVPSFGFAASSIQKYALSKGIVHGELRD